MSDAEHDLPHEGPIKTPKQLVWAIVASFVVPIIAIILLVNYVVADKMPAAGSSGLSAEAVAERIQPVGRIEIKDVSDPSTQKTGEQVYAGQCVTCHGSGVIGAPKFGDTVAWAPRLKTGYEALLSSALKGKAAMPAQGGGDFSDLEVARAVVYMANQGGAKFEPPKAPPAAATTAAAAPSARGDAGCRRAGRCRCSSACRGQGRCGARALHPDLRRVPCRRRGQRTQARRQGRLGTAPGGGRRRFDGQRHQGQGCDAAQGWHRCQRGRYQDCGRLHGGQRQVARPGATAADRACCGLVTKPKRRGIAA